jgi:hypothetical protein
VRELLIAALIVGAGSTAVHARCRTCASHHAVYQELQEDSDGLTRVPALYPETEAIKKANAEYQRAEEREMQKTVGAIARTPVTIAGSSPPDTVRVIEHESRSESSRRFSYRWGSGNVHAVPGSNGATTYYNDGGSYAGRSQRNGSSITYYDPDGGFHQFHP